MVLCSRISGNSVPSSIDQARLPCWQAFPRQWALCHNFPNLFIIHHFNLVRLTPPVYRQLGEILFLLFGEEAFVLGEQLPRCLISRISCWYVVDESNKPFVRVKVMHVHIHRQLFLEMLDLNLSKEKQHVDLVFASFERWIRRCVVGPHDSPQSDFLRRWFRTRPLIAWSSLHVPPKRMISDTTQMTLHALYLQDTRCCQAHWKAHVNGRR